MEAEQKLQDVSEVDVIRIMNAVFGFDGYNTAVLDVPSQWPVDEMKDGKYEVMAVARVRITAYVGGRAVSREATGIGMMPGTRDRTAALGNSLKEAETDALKRAFWQFGELLNCVYEGSTLPRSSTPPVTSQLDRSGSEDGPGCVGCRRGHCATCPVRQPGTMLCDDEVGRYAHQSSVYREAFKAEWGKEFRGLAGMGW